MTPAEGARLATHRLARRNEQREVDGLRLSRLYCQMFSTGSSSGDLAGSGIRVMLPPCEVGDGDLVQASRLVKKFF